jgi:hypothetical protein
MRLMAASSMGSTDKDSLTVGSGGLAAAFLAAMISAMVGMAVGSCWFDI